MQLRRWAETRGMGGQGRALCGGFGACGALFSLALTFTRLAAGVLAAGDLLPGKSSGKSISSASHKRSFRVIKSSHGLYSGLVIMQWPFRLVNHRPDSSGAPSRVEGQWRVWLDVGLER